MKKITREEAFASQNFDPNKVEIKGVPQQHVEALKAVANLFIIHDAVNANFKPDFENQNQRKYDNWFELGSPSGARFRYDVYGDWFTSSSVGARLVSESSDKARHIAAIAKEDYKAFMVYDRKTE